MNARYSVTSKRAITQNTVIDLNHKCSKKEAVTSQAVFRNISTEFSFAPLFSWKLHVADELWQENGKWNGGINYEVGILVSFLKLLSPWTDEAA